jgi:hypothetical protein
MHGIVGGTMKLHKVSLQIGDKVNVTIPLTGKRIGGIIVSTDYIGDDMWYLVGTSEGTSWLPDNNVDKVKEE